MLPINHKSLTINNLRNPLMIMPYSPFPKKPLYHCICKKTSPISHSKSTTCLTIILYDKALKAKFHVKKIFLNLSKLNSILFLKNSICLYLIEALSASVASTSISEQCLQLSSRMDFSATTSWSRYICKSRCTNKSGYRRIGDVKWV